MSDKARRIVAAAIRKYGLLVLTACTGLALSYAAFQAVAGRSERVAALELAGRANDHRLVVQSGLTIHLNKLTGLRALYKASDDVTRGEFQKFGDEILSGQDALLSVNFIARVPHAERDAHERAIRGEAGFADYRIKLPVSGGETIPAPARSEYFPIVYASAAQPGSPLYGLNLGDGGVRQATLERARDADELTTSLQMPIRTGEAGRRGFFAILPVYRSGQPHETVEDRRKNLIGFVQAMFRTGALIDTILSENVSPSGLDMYFFDERPGEGATPIHVYFSRKRTAPVEPLSVQALKAGPHWSGQIDSGDRSWTMIAAPIPGGPGTVSTTEARLAAGGCLLITLIAVAYIWTSRRYAVRLSANKDHLDAALNNMSQALLMFDASARLILRNHRYLEMYGLPADAAEPGTSFSELVQRRRQTGNFPLDADAYVEQVTTAVNKGQDFDRVVELPGGRAIAVVHRPARGGGWVATHEDITSRVRAEAKMSHMALHDALTGLPNRNYFREEVESRLAHLGPGRKFAVLCLDLDNFKGVNDTLGHRFGDGLLRQAAERVQGCLAKGDCVARLGGDEFAVLQADIAEAAEATALIARINEALCRPFDLDGHQAVVGVNIGIALAPADATSSDELLKLADMALHRAKADGRGTYRFFEAGMDASMQARRLLELDLRSAIARGEFELHYQPLVNLESEHISGFEALIRWKHPERGYVSPADFVPLAEETGLIVPIGEWVLRQACQQATRWPQHIRVAVNLSPIQFKSGNILQTVVQALMHARLPANRLELEITESLLLVGSDAVLNALHKLRDMGVRISMDDFGTGYSSLSYLRSFPFDKIKIDRSFVHGLAANEDAAAIIRAVASLGISLGMTTTGEGVETREERDRLRREGCIEAQGYFFSKPVPADQVFKLLAACGGTKAVA